MSKLVEARELRPQDLYETPNGSVYAVTGQMDPTGARHARLWCAHPPDAVTFDPPLVDLPPEQQVRLLHDTETRDHFRHDGYTQSAFGREMDRRNQAAMRVVNERTQLAATEQRQRERAGRPWWKKMFN